MLKRSRDTFDSGNLPPTFHDRGDASYVQLPHRALFYLAQSKAENALEKVKDYLKREPRAINAKNEYNESPLILAIQAENSDVAIELIKQGISLDSRSRDAFTPLHCAIAIGLLGVAQYMLEEKHVDVNQIGGITDSTALHIAVDLGNMEAVSLLLKNGADTTKCARDGATPFMIADAYYRQYRNHPGIGMNRDFIEIMLGFKAILLMVAPESTHTQQLMLPSGRIGNSNRSDSQRSNNNENVPPALPRNTQ